MARSKSQPDDSDEGEPQLKTRQRKAEAKRPDKVPYKELAEKLCDQIIDATEGYESTARYPVCSAALKYALRLIGQRYVQRTSRRAA